MSKDKPDPAPRKSRKTLLVALGGLAAVLVGVGGAWAAGLLPGGGHGEADAPDAEAAGEHGAAAEGSPHVPAEGASKVAEGIEGAAGASVITNLGAFTVNLRGSGGGRVLRLEVQVDTDAAVAELVTQRAPELRDSVILAVSDYTWSELEGVDGKTRLRDELLTRLNGVVAPRAIHRLYFTQFVVQ